MGERTNYPGVEPHRGSLRITFKLEGKRERKTLPLADVPANYPKAAKLRDDIVRAIKAGTFRYADFFPDSHKAVEKSRLFQDVAQLWLDSMEIAHSTIDTYRSALNKHWIPKFGPKPIFEASPGTVKKAIVDCGFTSEKNRNNCVHVLRQVFDYALAEGYINKNPCAGIKSAQVEQEEPDPFEPEEMIVILDALKKDEHPQTYNYFRFAFASGLRSSELIQLQWDRIDWRKRTVKIDEAFVKGRVKSTKTKRVRIVELDDEGIAALTAQKKYTLLRGKQVFHNPATDRPYADYHMQNRLFVKVVQGLKMRHRPAYNCRHTFATINLMAGANVRWLAKQMGHSVEMLLRRYTKWIEGADKSAEVSKRAQFMAAAVGANVGAKMGAKG